MNRKLQFSICIGLLILPGCFNRPGGPFGANARVPAPGTYQLKIPSLANNQPYYTPNQGLSANNPVAPVNPPINPNGAAPTASVADRNLQGWTLVNGQSQPQFSAQSQAPVYQSPHVIGNAGVAAAPNFQVATGSTLTSGASMAGTTVAAQANPTRVDSSRMAAIDASSIRPPSANPVTPQYFGTLQSTGINPPAANANGFSQPQMPNRFSAAQPVAGVSGSYQSPYIRQGSTFVQGFDSQGGAPGWVARDGSPGTNR
jgi:hypothetical protein